jgi:hypothetical protein
MLHYRAQTKGMIRFFCDGESCCEGRRKCRGIKSSGFGRGRFPSRWGKKQRENYRSPETIDAACVPERFSGTRSISTAIYFLITAGNFSAFHRIKSDECWHFYTGDPLWVHLINDATGEYLPGAQSPAVITPIVAQYFPAKQGIQELEPDSD